MTRDTSEFLVRRAFPWALFLFAVASLRFFWPLVFLTYILGSLMSGFVPRMQRFTGATRKRAVLLSYLTLVSVIAVALLVLVPRAWREAIEFGRERVPEFSKQIADTLWKKVPEENVQTITKLVKQTLEELQPAALIADAASVFKGVGTGLLFAFLTIMISLLVLLDPSPLRRGVSAIQRSKVGWIYDEVGPPVAEFFVILAEVFDAQIVIAVVNTTFTLAGMILLGIPGELFLSAIVFFCGLIPVFGAFLSSIPIVITALVQPSGFFLALKAVAMILIVHFLEAYVLNPRIMGDHLKMPPLVVLLTLLTGEHFFGIWGVLLGVPGITYLARWFSGPLPEASPQPALEPMTSSECLPAPPSSSPALQPPPAS